MGGVYESKNFILNVRAWGEWYERAGEKKKEIDAIRVSPCHLGAAPVTGAVENMGFKKESDFYLPYIRGILNSAILASAGDGYPDEKLLLSIEASRTLERKIHFFLKPYPQPVLLRRAEWAKECAEAVGVDIDAYNILTMREKVKLEKKSAASLIALRKFTKLPLIIKGVFTEDDVKLCEEVKADVVIVSNHGGRIERGIGSTADFLAGHIDELRKVSGEVWVDGGIRRMRDVQTALYMGASRVLLGRPFITAFMKGREEGIKNAVKALLS